MLATPGPFLIDLVLEAYFKSQSSDMRSQWMREMSGLSEDEMANIALQDYSFEVLLGNKDQEKIVDNLIKLKGDFLQHRLRFIQV